MDEIERDLMAVAMGDQDAVTRVAARMRGGQPNAQEQMNKALAAQQQNYLAVLEFRKQYADVANDEEAMALAKKLDTDLAAKRPDLPTWHRMQLVGETVRKRLGDPETRDHSTVIGLMRDRRDTLAKPSEADSITFNEDEVPPEESEHSSVIEQMRIDRLTQQGRTADIPREPVERAKPKRMHPFPHPNYEG